MSAFPYRIDAGTVFVQVGDRVKRYPHLPEELAQHLSVGGKVGPSIHSTLARIAPIMRNVGIDSTVAWVRLDDTDLAYFVLITKSGRYTIKGAAPVSGAEQ